MAELIPYDYVPNGGGDSRQAPREPSAEEKLVRQVHAATVGTCKVAAHAVQRMTGIPGVATKASRKGKKSREQYLSEAVDAWPYLLRPAGSGTYHRFDIDLKKFDELLVTYGSQYFGSWEEWGSPWASGEVMSEHFAEPVEEDCDGTLHEPRDDDVLACTLTEHVDLAALRARHQGGSDRRPDVLRRYITRCENEGDIMGNYADVRVSYYRKRGLPGRMYARGPALQWLTKESHAAALAGMSYSVDIQNCFPTLLLHEVRKLHTKDDVPLRSLELFVKYHAIWRGVYQGVIAS